MKILLFTLLFISLFSTHYSQLNGTYQGTWQNKKIIATIQTTNSMAIGAIYENQSIFHKLQGGITKDSIKAIIFYNNLLEIPCKGTISKNGKQLEMTAYFIVGDSIVQTSTIFLTKISNSTEVELNKYFAERVLKKEYNPTLIGKWQLLKKTDEYGKDITPKSIKNGIIIFRDKGRAEIFLANISPNNKALQEMDITWFNENDVLYINMKMPNNNFESHESKFKIIQDTLFTMYANGSQEIYIRK
ncbi:MAG: hypothetical protein MUE81_19520 [Thermoflexibacter sp.]|jgi:hypothetical protein|nr:hypothetical protein [Thermoflexibacter sp.]